jgi:hypothetical protein
MDANSFLKRITLFALLTAFPLFTSAAPPGGGGHSSRGGGGHSAGGGRGGGHAVGGRGHAVGGRGQVIGGRGRAVIGGRGQVFGGRSSAGMQANAGIARRGTGPMANSRSFLSDPSGRGDWKRGGGDWKRGRGDWKHGRGDRKDGHGDWKDGHRTAWNRGDKDHHHHRRHRRVSFAFWPYWYPSGGYYNYGYPGYPYDYYDYYYPDNGYYSEQSEPASIQGLVQQALASRGYYAGQLDGLVGPETRSAIREFQRDNGLPETGLINSELIQALKIG